MAWFEASWDKARLRTTESPALGPKLYASRCPVLGLAEVTGTARGDNADGSAKPGLAGQFLSSTRIEGQEIIRRMTNALGSVLAAVLLACTACAHDDGMQAALEDGRTCDGGSCPEGGLSGLVSGSQPAAVSVPLRPSRPDPERTPLRIAEIEAMPAGSWLHYGRPWSDIDPGRENNCGRGFGTVLGAWNGVLWDDHYVWSWAAGGHGDGCFNGIIRYDLRTGTPEMVVPHLPLNVPLCRPFVKSTGEEDCYWEPYVSETPYPGGMDQRIAEWHGGLLRPRSSHIYNNLVKVGDWVYLWTGYIYGSAVPDAQVWRFNARADDVAATIERLPDRFDPNRGSDRDGDGKPDGKRIGSVGVNWVLLPGEPPLMFSGASVCEADMVSGRYRCTQHPKIHFTIAATLAWDEERGGVWGIDANLNRLVFARRAGGKWAIDEGLSLKDEVLTKTYGIGSAGICLVPTENGANPVIWGEGRELLRWDGETLHAFDLPGGPEPARRRILNKWTWNEDLGVCWGTWSVNEGFWVYKPAFASKHASTLRAQAAPASQSRQQPKPEPAAGAAETAGPKAEPEPAPELGAAADVTALGVAGLSDYPVFAGHRAAPAPWQPAAWDQPIERQPEAPDYDALCPGGWKELHYRSDGDLTDVGAQMRRIVRGGRPNVRVYLHARLDDRSRVIPYINGIHFDEVRCAEIVGVPANGQKPHMKGSISGGSVGLIARGIALSGKKGVVASYAQAFLVFHDLDVHAIGQIFGSARPAAPLTYLEFRGNVMGNNTDWHVLYLERSIGRMVALSNVFYGSGRGRHAFKNLAHQSRIEGNVFSNVGVDGQVLAVDKNNKPIIGNMSLDLYLCTETLLRNNTVLFRTSSAIRSFIDYRGRHAWGNCNKGRRQSGGRWEYWSPESPDYGDPARWAEIARATSAFERGYEAAKADPWLFTHRIEGNRFIVFNAAQRGGAPLDDTSAARIATLRPIASNPRRKELIDEALSLAKGCANSADRKACMLAGMSAGLRYAFDHLSPSNQDAMIKRGIVARAAPIPAPEQWIERAGVFWGSNTFITCSADGQDCREAPPRPVQLQEPPWDPVVSASPPRVIYE